MSRFAAYSMLVLAYLIGGGSMLLFGAFLVFGPVTIVHLPGSELAALI